MQSFHLMHTFRLTFIIMSLHVSVLMCLMVATTMSVPPSPPLQASGEQKGPPAVADVEGGSQRGPPLGTEEGPLGPPISAVGGQRGPPPFEAGANMGPPPLEAGGQRGPPTFEAGANRGPPPFEAGGKRGPPALATGGQRGPPPFEAGGHRGPPPLEPEEQRRSEAASSCVTVSGPTAGQPCVFPFRYSGRVYTECADWVFGGQRGPWCSTRSFRNWEPK